MAEISNLFPACDFRLSLWQRRHFSDMKFPNLGFLLLFFVLISAKPFLEEIEPDCPGGFFSPQLQRKPEIDKNIPERVIGGQVTVKFI